MHPTPSNHTTLVEETENLASDVLPPSLFVVHDTGRGGEDNVAELTRRQQLDDPLLHVAELDVVAGRDDASLVDAAIELDDDLAVAVVVDLLELANVACRMESVCCGEINIRHHGRDPKTCKFSAKVSIYRALKGQRSCDARSLSSYQPEGAQAMARVVQGKSRRTVALHDGQELDDDLGGRANQDLALAGLLGVVDGIEAVVEDGSLDHGCGCRGRFSMAVGD
tara:strand:+ start:10779 stop:11450 length:672 start_codon:yes stop_codon:yes gene_type:complete